VHRLPWLLQKAVGCEERSVAFRQFFIGRFELACPVAAGLLLQSIFCMQVLPEIWSTG
jgi:hypothetical protein